LAFAGVWTIYCFVDILCNYLAARAAISQNKFDDMLVPLFRRTLKILVVIGGLVYLATQWSDDLWSIVAGLGIGSVALAFAARDSVENLFGTFTVLLDKPFQIGDWITMGDLDGDVESVGFRSTKVRTFYNSLVTVPNRHFISGQVDNMGARRYRRIKTTLALTYDTPPEKVEAFCEGVREVIRKHPHTRKDYFHVYLNGLGASSLDIMLYCFVEVPDWSAELSEKHRLFADILRVGKALEVEFAFPTQSLHVVTPENLVHPNTPENNEAGKQLGREVANAILKETL
jgi:MscS family membrane protein